MVAVRLDEEATVTHDYSDPDYWSTDPHNDPDMSLDIGQKGLHIMGQVQPMAHGSTSPHWAQTIGPLDSDDLPN